jgi:hypothetical protein
MRGDPAHGMRLAAGAPVWSPLSRTVQDGVRKFAMKPEIRPFFEVPGGTGPRMLLISYHFPPGRSAGALRWQKLAQFAAERGWRLDVIALDPAAMASPDMARLDDLPAGTRVFGVAETKPISQRVHDRLARGSRAIRAGVRRRGTEPGANGRSGAPARGAVPIAEIRWLMRTPREVVRTWNSWLVLAGGLRWARDAEALARRIVDPAEHRVILTCGPPHLEHEAGRSLSMRTGLPHVVDLRDGWSVANKLPEPVASRLWLHAARRFERRVIADAKLVVVNTESLGAAMRKLYPEAQDRILTVMNGYDEVDVPEPSAGGTFLIAYTGNIYLDRDPRPLFRAAGTVVRELGLKPSDLRIEFMGHVEDYGGVATAQLARAEGLADHYTERPPGPHSAVRNLLARAAMLVSLPQDVQNAIPSKIFEYMPYHAWLLVFARSGSAPDLLLRDSAADVVDPDDFDRIVSILRRRVLDHRQGVTPVSLSRDGRFSRREQARTLLDAIQARVGA